jgi:hypothetical protein
VNVIYRHRRIKGGEGAFSKERYLIIQVSLPKLLFGVSLFDINEQMLKVFITKLIEKMRKVNIVLEPEAVKNAIVIRVDYSKILKIAPSYGSPASIIKQLSDYDYKFASDFTKNKFYHGKDGYYIKFYNPSQSLVIYDKIDEILEQGETRLEQEIQRLYKTKKYRHGALRIELSLQTKQIVDLTLKRFYSHKTKDFTLAEAVNTEVSKALLLEKYERIYMQGFSKLMGLKNLKDTEVQNYLAKYVPKFKDRAILYYLTHRVQQFGLRETTKELQKECAPSTVSRYKSRVQKLLDSATAKKDTVNIIGYLYRKLKRFAPIYPKNLARYL